MLIVIVYLHVYYRVNICEYLCYIGLFQHAKILCNIMYDVSDMYIAINTYNIP